MSEDLVWCNQVQGGRRVPGGVPHHVHGLQPHLLAHVPALREGRVTLGGRGGHGDHDSDLLSHHRHRQDPRLPVRRTPPR